MKILFNNDLYAYVANNRDELKNCLIENGIDPQPNDIEDAAAQCLDDEYNDLVSCLKEYDNKSNYDYILVCGSLGLWRGRRQVKAKIKSLYDAFTKCCGYDSYMLYFDKVNNTLQIKCYHHDGCNEYKIYSVKNNKKTAIKLNDLLACY